MSRTKWTVLGFEPRELSGRVKIPYSTDEGENQEYPVQFAGKGREGEGGQAHFGRWRWPEYLQDFEIAKSRTLNWI